MKYKQLTFFGIVLLSIAIVQLNDSASKSKNSAKILLVINDCNIFDDDVKDNNEIFVFCYHNLKEPQPVDLCYTTLFCYMSITQITINRFMKYSPWSKGTFS
jgi:hypothetical protein